MPDDVGKTLAGILAELSGLFDRMDGIRVEALAEALADAGVLFVAGAGRSGLLLRCFAMRVMHMGKEAHMLGDVTTPAARRGDMLLVGSGSGETGSLVVMAKKAGSLGVKVALVTANPASTLAGMADIVVVVPAPSPKAAATAEIAVSSQPMGNLFEQGMFLLLDAVVMRIMRKLGLTADGMFKRHANLE